LPDDLGLSNNQWGNTKLTKEEEGWPVKEQAGGAPKLHPPKRALTPGVV